MRTTPPPGGPVRNISYPEVPCGLLDNGIEVLCVSDHHLPRVSILVAIPSGSAHDPGPQGGLHRLSMEMLKEGTRELDSRRIAEVLDDHALDFSAEVRQEQTFLEMTGLERQLLPGLELLSALLQDASFPEHELARVKQRWRSVLLSQRSDEGFLSGERLQADLFSDHPYSRVSFRPEHLDSITRDSMVQLLHHRLPTSETRVVFAGAVTPGVAVDMAGRFFAHWKPRSDRPGVSRPNQVGRPGRVSLVHRPNSAQVRIALGRRAVPVNHPDYLPLRLANQVLGGGGSARLFLNLREVRGYTYGVYSSLQGLEQDGVLSISAGVRTDAVVDSIEQVLVELERMSTAPPDEAELGRCRSELIGSFIRNMETPDSIASLEAGRRLKRLPADYYSNYIPAIRGLTRDEIVRVSRDYFDPAGWHIVVVGDRGSLEEPLTRFGEVVLFDRDGKPLENGEVDD